MRQSVLHAVDLSSSSSPAAADAADGGGGGRRPGRTAPSMRRREFYCEEIDQRTKVSLHEPLTTKELVDSARSHVFDVFYFILLVLAATFLCIITQRDVPLAWILPAVAVISLITFHHLKLWLADTRWRKTANNYYKIIKNVQCISQGSVATRIRGGWIFNAEFVDSLLLIKVWWWNNLGNWSASGRVTGKITVATFDSSFASPCVSVFRH